ncbi:MAG: hypothetical protein HZB43_12040 [candidate division Zixibacteria bacterium]|nr:hypothetical protein [candidate division Zixibacteria bacterium]
MRCPAAYPSIAATPSLDKREAIAHWDRYLKEQGRPLSQPGCRGHLVYLPFWHARAIVAIQHTLVEPHPPERTVPLGLSSLAHDLWNSESPRIVSREPSDPEWEIKPWDFSYAAFENGLSGMDSLGVRAQTISLRDCSETSASEETLWWSATGQAADAVPRLEAAVASLLAHAHGSVPNRPRIISPQVSLIYWPVWIITQGGRDQLAGVEMDAVSGRVIREISRLPRLPEPGAVIEGEAPRLLPHRCPSCGADLPADGFLSVFPCANCRVLIAQFGNGDRRALTCEFAEGSAPRGSLWHPFWAFEPDQIMVPAFPIRNYRALVRFGMIVSGQNRSFSVPSEPPNHLVGVSLLPDIAAGFAALIHDQESPSPDSCALSLPRLVFIPLRPDRGELTDSVTGLCLPKAALASRE